LQNAGTNEVEIRLKIKSDVSNAKSRIVHAQISSRKSNSISEFVTRESASAYINPKLAKAKEVKI